MAWRLYKVLKVREEAHVARAQTYSGGLALRDVRCLPPEGLPAGGNGLAFDWTILNTRRGPSCWPEA